jgi:glyoxylate carboligase
MSENKPNSGHVTVYDATYNLLRKLGLTTMFGNPGSTEQPFLKNFRKTFNMFSVSRRRLLSRWQMDSHRRHGSLCL